jgi:hypothetical protein
MTQNIRHGELRQFEEKQSKASGTQLFQSEHH